MSSVEISQVIDVQTVYLMAGLVCLLSGCTLALLRHLHEPSRQAIIITVAALMCGSVSLFIGAVASALPAWVVGWLSMVGAGASFALMLEGMRQLYGGRNFAPTLLGAVGFLAVVLGMAPDPRFALLVHLTFQFGCTLATVVVVKRAQDPVANKARWGVMVLFSTFALAALARGGVVLFAPHASALDPAVRFGQVQGVVVMMYTLCPVVLMMLTLSIVYHRQLAALTLQAATDELTGLASRRHLFGPGQDWIVARAAQHKDSALLMIDIDRFKSINDQFGHLAGDAVLRHVAAVLRRSLPPGSLVARYGGEEFCALVPIDADGIEASLAEHLRAAVEAAPFQDEALIVRTTVSVGTAQYQRGMTLQELVREADRRVYRAKTDGRNRVVTDEPVLDTAVV